MNSTRRPMLHSLVVLSLGLAACDSVAPDAKGASHGKTPTVRNGKAVKPVGDRPKIACDEPSFNYGTVSQGATVEHVYKIKNVGGAPLTIARASGG